MEAPPESLQLFISYSHVDSELVDRLRTHLTILERQNAVKVYDNKVLSAGQEWELALRVKLQQSDIVLCLISADYLASDFVFQEISFAMELNVSRGARIIPVILRPCDWTSSPLARFQALPTNARPVTQWQDQDEAFQDIVRELRKVIQRLAAERTAGKPQAVFDHPGLPKGYERLRLAFLAVLENPELFPFLESWDQAQYPSALDPSAFERLRSKHADSEPPPLWTAWMQAVHPEKLGIEETADFPRLPRLNSP
jgi:TIR domain